MTIWDWCERGFEAVATVAIMAVMGAGCGILVVLLVTTVWFGFPPAVRALLGGLQP